ncbi:MAG: hypothetical protein R2743_14355 [Ilumatobacteraceae bacterium]
MSEWWTALEREIGARSERAPDPWSHRAGEPVSLTPEQHRLLTESAAAAAISSRSSAEPAGLDLIGDAPVDGEPRHHTD